MPKDIYFKCDVCGAENTIRNSCMRCGLTNSAPPPPAPEPEIVKEEAPKKKKKKRNKLISGTVGDENWEEASKGIFGK